MARSGGVGGGDYFDSPWHDAVKRGFAVPGEEKAYDTTVLSLVPPWQAGFALNNNDRFEALVKEGYRSNAIVYSCINLLATAVPEAIMRWYACDATGEHALDDFPGRHLIARPNPYQTEFEFWEMTMRFLCICGKAFWWKERGNDPDLGPIALWPLRPDRMQPILGSDTRNLLQGWDYSTAGQHMSIPAGDVLYFNHGDPGDPTAGILGGIGPLQVLAHEVDIDNEATKFVYSLLKNHATPGIVLRAKGKLTLEDAERAKQKFVEKYGDMRRGVPAVIDADTDITAIGFNLRQLEFPDLRGLSESRCAAAFGAPPILVGLLVGLQHATYSNMESARQFFAETTLTTHWRRLGDQIECDLTPEYAAVKLKTKYQVPPTARFDTSKVRALAVHASAVAERYWRVYQFGGITKNEMRAAMGLPALATGDVYVSPMNMQEVPAGETADQVAAPASAGHEPAEVKESAALPAQPRARLTVLCKRRKDIHVKDVPRPALPPGLSRDTLALLESILADDATILVRPELRYLVPSIGPVVDRLRLHPAGVKPLRTYGVRTSYLDTTRGSWSTNPAGNYAKVRLREYESASFLELKWKVDGLVYKARIPAPAAGMPTDMQVICETRCTRTEWETADGRVTADSEVVTQDAAGGQRVLPYEVAEVKGPVPSWLTSLTLSGIHFAAWRDDTFSKERLARGAWERTLYLVRHGPAGEHLDDPAGDAARSLTPQGRQVVAQSAAGVAALGIEPGFALVSPLPRARQTAQIFVRDLHVVGGMRLDDALREIESLPDTAHAAAFLAALGGLPNHALVVSHSKALENLLMYLGGAQTDAPTFRLGEASVTKIAGEDIAIGQTAVHWHLEAEHLAQIAAAGGKARRLELAA